MSLWSLHPRYLDKHELIKSWNDGIKHLEGLRKNPDKLAFNPEMCRFMMQSQPVEALEAYLRAIRDEARRRHLQLKPAKLRPAKPGLKLPVTLGQVEYEWRRLMSSLARRSPKFVARVETSASYELNPVFFLTPDKRIETWQKLA